MSSLRDNNVLSELQRSAPHPRVAAWFAQRPAGTFYIRERTLGEMRRHIQNLTDAARRLPLVDCFETELPNSLTAHYSAESRPELNDT